MNAMLECLTEEANVAYTENDAVSYATTGADCLDLFASVGALRNADRYEIEKRFMRAFAENPLVATKIAFYARDVRGGLGERSVGRILLRWMAQNAQASLRKNMNYIAEYGRFDDLISLLDTPCEADVLELIKCQWAADVNALASDDASVSLLGKWLPSINASNKDARRHAMRIAKALGMTCAEYRRALTKLRKQIDIIENRLRVKDYSFDYSNQPSKAMLRYKQAFLRNDKERYSEFLDRVNAGEAKLNTKTLTPYEVILPFFTQGHMKEKADLRKSIDTTWNALEDFTRGENALVVMDGSGSMYSSAKCIAPIVVAQSLAIYFAERNKGAFHGHFITFSEKPQMVQIKGADIYEKVRYCSSYNEIANTNVLGVFKLILDTAIKHNIPQSEMPTSLYFISDMEFDACADDADQRNFDYAKQLFAQHGYRLPNIVFWNVDSRTNQQPVKKNEQGVALVSGLTPRIFAMIKDNILDPYAFMMSVLDSPRYEKIVA